MSTERRICIGVIMGAHGVRGQIRLRSFTADPESLFAYKPLTSEDGQRVFAVTRKDVMKNYFVAALPGVADREAAEALRGTKLYIERSVLPPAQAGEYYEADLIGLAARTAENEAFGAVEAVHDYGAGTFLEIKPKGGKSFMLPFNDDLVPVVDVAAGYVLIVVPEGWLDEEKPQKAPKKGPKA